MESSSDKRPSSMCGPWKLFRIVFRIVLFGALTWFLLALLWAFLPSPTKEHDDDNAIEYATSVLRSGKTLTRVYDSKILPAGHYERHGFALDFKADFDNLTISVGEQAFPIIHPTWQSDWDGAVTINHDPRTVSARIGDTDGANLPWFPFADSVLLFWWIHKEEMSLPLFAQYQNVDEHVRRTELRSNGRPSEEPLLAVEIRDADPSTIVVSIPADSSSPSLTYPVRVAIIHVIAPTAVFVNDLLGNIFGEFIEWMVTALFVGLVVVWYGLVALAIVFSLWRCFKGPSFEDTVERIQGRLETLSQNERLRGLKIDVLRQKVEVLCQNERFLAIVYVCRNGWHPERDRAVAAEEAADVEKGLGLTEEGEGDEKGEIPSSKQ